MMRALACFLTAIACLYAATAHADYIGSYDVGDTITLHCAINDNGTAADSVSGDSVKAIIFWGGARVDTIGLDLAGASLPTSSAFFAKIAADTTAIGGYGTWWAVLWAVNVGAGTRDPVGTLTWQLEPKIASASGIVPRVTVADSVTGAGNVQHTALTDSVALLSGSAVYAAAESVWYFPLAALSVDPSLSGGVLRAIEQEARGGAYLGQYQQGDSITVGSRINQSGIDSVLAYIAWEKTPIDTVKLVASASGYYETIMADTTGAGWGSWHATLQGFIASNHSVYTTNTWSLRDQHLYAKEVAESADVYIHDPDDSTIALVVRDSLNAWADSFQADSAIATGIESTHVYIDDRYAIAALGADSTWGAATRTLSASEYAEIADSVSATVTEWDTLAYVANVGTVGEVETTLVAVYLDSGRVLSRAVNVDTTGFLDTGRTINHVSNVDLVDVSDSLVAGARIRLVDHSLLNDSTTNTAHTDSIDGAARVALAARTTVADSMTAGGTLKTVATVSGNVNGNVLGYVARLLEMVDSLQAELSDEGADSANARLNVPTIAEIAGANRDTLIAHRDTFAVSDLDSIGKVGWVGVTDSGRVVQQANFLVLGDSLRAAGKTDSTGIAAVTLRADSLVRGWMIDTTATGGRVKTVASVTALGATALADVSDTTWNRPIYLEGETLAARVLLARVDTAATDSVGVVGTVHELIHGDSIDAFQRGLNVSNVAVVAVAESLVHGAVVDLVDSSRVTARSRQTDNISYVDSVGALRWGWDVAQVAVVAYSDSNRITAVTERADSFVAGERVANVAEVAHTESTTAFARGETLGVVGRVDSTVTAGSVYGLTTTTITNAVAAKTVGGTANTWGRILADIDTASATARDSLGQTTISTLAHTGDAMTLTGAEKAYIADSTWYYLALTSSYPSASPGGILWNIQEDSLATIAQMAGAGADSTRALIAASALQDSVDSIAVRIGAYGDTTLISRLQYIRDNLNSVTFSGASAALVRDSLLGATIADGSGGALYDSSTVGGALWEAGPDRLYRTLHVTIDSSTVDTTGVRLGAYKTSGGSAPSGGCVYVHALADSGWSSVLGKDCDLGASGEFYVGQSYQPPDTTYYRVRFHALGYNDIEKIVRFPQP